MNRPSGGSVPCRPTGRRKQSRAGSCGPQTVAPRCHGLRLQLSDQGLVRVPLWSPEVIQAVATKPTRSVLTCQSRAAVALS
jgi:hypothetical protein